MPDDGAAAHAGGGAVIDLRLGEHTVRRGDCVEVMQSMPENSVDAIVTDPPYGLGFMGKKWDDLPPGDDFAREAFRVCKPGAFIVAFGGTRTVHRLTVALEDAGFEIRDTLHWNYWSGFPKSLDVSKAMDRVERGALVRVKLEHFSRLRGIGGKWLEAQGIASAASFADWTSGGHVPSDRNWGIIKSALEITDEEEAEFERDVLGQSNNGIAGGTGEHAGSVGAYGFGSSFDITQPATESARQWQGWGTALKPAIEPAVMARKPLIGTVADNVLQWGTGALNIDASRIAYGDPAWPGPGGANLNGGAYSRDSGQRGAGFVIPRGVGDFSDPGGRFPANLYYCPKASTAEREAGCSDLRQQAAGELTGGREEGSAGLDSPRAGAGRSSNGRGNSHPTVKPIRLMRWIVRLVTPPGGVVLEPFAGSGTTLLAAELADIGARCVAIEREAPYIDIIRARWSARAVLRRMLTRPVSEAEGGELMRQGDLFGEVGT
jgi:hypothetical protein